MAVLLDSLEWSIYKTLYTRTGSSVVEQEAFNLRVEGSIPSRFILQCIDKKKIVLYTVIVASICC